MESMIVVQGWEFFVPVGDPEEGFVAAIGNDDGGCIVLSRDECERIRDWLTARIEVT